ncbi:MAG: formylglycine-generating enzyme family protein, partial [Planctomycetota bacterium]
MAQAVIAVASTVWLLPNAGFRGNQREPVTQQNDRVQDDATLPESRQVIIDPPSPPLAVTPFNAEQAREHQHEWASFLNLPVARTVKLPGGEMMQFMLIPPGEFLMGSSESSVAQFMAEAVASADDRGRRDRIPWESPQHRVQISRPFYLAVYETTQAQWECVTGNNPSQFPSPSNPVEMVSWNDIQGLLAVLNDTAK